MKTVKIEIEVEVSDEAKFVAVDKTGTIYEYWKKPIILKDDRMWDARRSDLKSIRVLVSNWTKTLTEVE